MKRSRILGIILILALLVAMIFVLFTPNIFDAGYAVTQKGNVSHNVVTGWDIVCRGHSIEKDNLWNAMPWFYWPWETKDQLIVCTLTHEMTGEEHSGEDWVGTGSAIYGDDSYSVVIHNVPEGTYQCTCYLYEVEKGMLWGEVSRSLKGSCSAGTIEVPGES